MHATLLIEEGDWVSGTSPSDEKFIGFVESISGGGAGVKVWVTQCDREEAVGTSIEASLAKVKKLPDQVPSAREELRSLIELSLMTQDKQWFEALSAQMNTAATPAADHTAGESKRYSPLNRLHRIMD
jgi:hypothetical protein